MELRLSGSMLRFDSEFCIGLSILETDLGRVDWSLGKSLLIKGIDCLTTSAGWSSNVLSGCWVWS